MIEDAIKHYEEGRFDEAEVLFKTMHEEEPDNPEVLFMLSLIRQQKGDFGSSVELLDRAINSHPENATYHQSRGGALLQLGQGQAAEASFRQAIKLDPNYVEAQNALGYCQLISGRFEEAESQFRVALVANAEYSPAVINMGITLLEQGQHDEAIRYLQNAVALSPEEPSAQANLGRAFMMKGQMAFAEQCFDNALKVLPDSPDLNELAGQVKLAQGYQDEAEIHFRKVLDHGAERAESLWGLARIARGKGEFSRASNLYLGALRLSPERADVRLDFAQYLSESGRDADVLHRLQPLVSAEEHVPVVQKLLATSLMRLGRLDEAEYAMELMEEHTESPAECDLLRLQLFAARGQSDEADQVLARLLDQESPAIEALLFSARRALDAGNTDGAESQLRDCRRRHDINRAQRKQVAQLLAEVSDRKDAPQAAWEQLLSLGDREAGILEIFEEQPQQLGDNEPAESAMKRDVAWSWPPQPPEDNRPEPVFIVGWPGTGRQALIDALAAHPRVQMGLGETDQQKERRLAICHPQGAGPLTSLSEADQLLKRRRYWKEMRKSGVFAGPADKVMDAMQVPVEGLPTIYRLFPQARIIVLKRDAGDVALSWLFAGFKDTDVMATRYAQQSALLAQCEAEVPMKYLPVQTEELRSAPGEILRNLIQDLELGWDDAVEEAYQGANLTHLRSPGRWQQYADYIDASLIPLGLVEESESLI